MNLQFLILPWKILRCSDITPIFPCVKRKFAGKCRFGTDETCYDAFESNCEAIESCYGTIKSSYGTFESNREMFESNCGMNESNNGAIVNSDAVFESNYELICSYFL